MPDSPLDLPTFLKRGHPDCVVGAPAARGRALMPPPPKDPLAHTGRRKTPAQVAALSLLGYTMHEMRGLKPRDATRLIRTGTIAAAFRTRRALRGV